MSQPLGQHLRHLRLKHGFTQQQLADSLNLDRSTVAYRVYGKRPNSAQPAHPCQTESSLSSVLGRTAKRISGISTASFS
ncbi:helix-turn-helix transcriptional regulator [Caproicibacterium amylolyticum]|uniref:Helix-turn-helix transcriptional regulator n=1 Tax=Caproicibacterium amylolyticum TaxID=2766537 RepID=A0A7G9WI91_9FIRM|nr:helix-turn-helix transcriptional regulator [Caproicibacterium amylolyticum]